MKVSVRIKTNPYRGIIKATSFLTERPISLDDRLGITIDIKRIVNDQLLDLVNDSMKHGYRCFRMILDWNDGDTRFIKMQGYVNG